MNTTNKAQEYADNRLGQILRYGMALEPRSRKGVRARLWIDHRCGLPVLRAQTVAASTREWFGRAEVLAAEYIILIPVYQIALDFECTAVGGRF